MTLTPKQEDFAQAVAGGLNHSDAYRLAYTTEAMAPATIWNNAYVLAKHNEVAARITQIRDAVTAHQVWTKERMIAALEENLERAEQGNKWSAALKTLKLIGEITGLLPVKGRWPKRPPHSGYSGQGYPSLTDDALRTILQKAQAWRP